MKHTHPSSARIAILGSLLATSFLTAKTVEYELTIASAELSPAGRLRPAMTINGGIPGPVLRFTEGDMAVMHVRNDMDVPTSIHWHGLLVPPNMDGVPFVSYPPIQPGTTFTYRFPIRQAGTYWYHSHTELQEQLGVYGGIVIQPRQKRIPVDDEHVVVLSDWTDWSPDKVMRLLRRGSEFMGIRKKTGQSLLGAWKTGKMGEFWLREAMRMPPMDLADVAYDAFLINGQQRSEIHAKPGATVRLRIVDGSATTYFHLQYAGGPLKIVAADGQDVVPTSIMKPLLIGVAETYDVVVKVPAAGSYEFRATSHDGSGFASLWIGSGEEHPVKPMPQPYQYDTMDMFSVKNLFALTPAGTMGMPNHEVRQGKFDQSGMNMEGMKMDEMNSGGSVMSGMDHGRMEMGGMDHEGMKMDHGDKTMGGMSGGGMGIKENRPRWYDFLLREDVGRFPQLATDSMMSDVRPFPPYKMLRATKNTAFDPKLPRHEIRLTLDGDMGRYVWMFNNETLAPSNDIKIRKGEVARFIFINRTMMHHPLHLHGHFFRVINGQGDHSPLKHTVNVEPMTTTVIEFEANEVGDWFFHCHLLYHMKGGMARVVRYDSFTNDSETEAVASERYAQHWYLFAQADILSNMTQGRLRFENLRNTFGLSWYAGWDGVENTTWEAEITYDRYINRFTSVFAGAYLEGEDWNSEAERGIFGLRYLLPLNVVASAWVDTDGEARVNFGRELMLTPRLSLFGEAEYDTREKWQFQTGVSYTLTENIAATALWDTNYGAGVGMTVRF